MSSRCETALTGLALALSACSRAGAPNKHDRPAPAPSEAQARWEPGTPSPGTSAAAPPVAIDFLVVGGGTDPESTEVSLEQNVELVMRTLKGPGAALFAGGSSAESVRELDPAHKGDAVLTALGDLLSPRAGRGSRYRAPHFTADRANLENVEQRLGFALSEGTSPLLVYVATHGDQGKEPRDNSIALWGGRTLSVARLAEIHEQHERPMRLVATSCFSGGFAELAFARADEKAGPSSVPRCGLFAGTWDRETSGCDPNPDRRAQESYGLHFVHALGGTRRDGTPLPAGAADFDGDGKVGPLDAHTWARIEASSFDVPTTTSERWLRGVEPDAAPIDRTLSPEDAAVVERLGAALKLDDEAAVERRFEELDTKLGKLGEEMDEASRALADREADETTLLLERWPVLDDPFHPEFEVTFERNRHAVARLLFDSPAAKAREEAARRVEELGGRLDEAEIEEARVTRVRRAYETLHKVAALTKKGGPSLEHYRALVLCERGGT